MPVSAIAHFTPVVITNLDEAAIVALLETRPYQRFPVARNGAIDGVLLRSEVTQARAENRPMRLLPAVSARPHQTIRECQALLIESTCGMIVITDKPHGSPLAVVTLHDLLRAQAAISERAGDA